MRSAGFYATFLVCLAGLLLQSAAFTAQAPVFNIPHLENVTIDGNASDWGDRGFRVEMLAGTDGQFRPASQLDGKFRLGWSEKGLLVLISVRDDLAIEADDESMLWQKDCVELYLIDKLGGNDMIQVVIAPGMDPKYPGLRYHIYDLRKSEALKKVIPSLKVACAKTRGGYTMEVLLPWENLGVSPKVGTEAAFQLFVDDYGRAGGQTNLVWYPAAGTFNHTDFAYTIKLSDKPSAPVLVAGRATYDGVKSTRVTIVGAPELAGKAVSARADGKEIAKGTLSERDGRASAILKAPIPPAGREWKTVDLYLGRTKLDTVELPDLTQIRARAVQRLSFLFHPFCFSGNRLPDGDFEDPSQAENAFGAYTVNVTYYDSGFNPVQSAEKPGRYAAVVEIKPENGLAIKRFYTLFRFPEYVDWRNVKTPVSIELPKETGLNPEIVKEQSENMGDFIRRRIVDGFDRAPESAEQFAWLSEISPGVRANDRTGPYACNQKWLYQLKRKNGYYTPLKYYVRLPEGADKTGSKLLPTIIFLHGSGERGQDVALRADGPVMKHAKAHKDFPFIVIAAQCPGDSWWDALVPDLDDMFSDIVAKYPVDRDRIYLTGLSMGGFGSWRWSTEHPDWFAAVAPVCGGGDPTDVKRIKDLPIWVFHGGKDPTVPVQRSYDMVDALKKVDGRVQMTIYPEAGHNSWDQAYSTDELYAWMLRQVRGKPEAPRSGTSAAH